MRTIGFKNYVSMTNLQHQSWKFRKTPPKEEPQLERWIVCLLRVDLCRVFVRLRQPSKMALHVGAQAFSCE